VTDDVAARSQPLTPLGDLFGAGRRWPRHRDDHEYDRTLEVVFHEGSDAFTYLWRFGSLIVLSTMIAAFGLISNSTAVVIGAMLVAPLMEPLQAVAVALIQGWTFRLITSVAIVGGGVAGAVATGWVVTAIAGGVLVPTDLPTEILSRTNPSLIDLGIAVAAGAAGGYVLTHPSAGSALPGVGIAVALVPPLGTVGICLNLGVPDLASGAMLLFVTNLAAIVLSVAIMVLGAGFLPRTGERRQRGRTGTRLALAALLVVLVSVPLTIHTIDTIREESLTREVVDAVDSWSSDVRLVDLEVSDENGTAVVHVVVAGPQRPTATWRLAQSLAKPDRPVDLTLSFQQELVDEATVR
jgi:uncharacterized hydrophobic protein (TIGR00271 family)